MKKIKEKLALVDYIKGIVREEIICNKYLVVECVETYPFIFHCVLSWKIRLQLFLIARKQIVAEPVSLLGKEIVFKCVKRNLTNTPINIQKILGTGVAVKVLF